MNKLVVSVVTFVAMLLSSSVKGQLMCYQGTTAITAAGTTGSIASSACALGTDICHRRSTSTTTLGVTSKKINYSNIFLFKMFA